MARTAVTDVCGIVLAGGRSTRMGVDKATLPWGESTMLETVVAMLRVVLPHVIVVAAPGQQLPAVAAGIVRDPVPDQGPLRGLATGLAAARAAGFEWAFAAATDTPLLTAAAIRQLLAERADVDAVIGTAEGRDEPLVALYRARLASPAADLLAAGQRRLQDLIAGRTVRRVALADSVAAFNVNTAADADRARGLSN
ncbi:molybdenum cofactor guanylyltransferase [Tomitella biformata]|uniref:molybdenum cofactor guanylyltransferase n=1 Tax=Tomitella biformata TaxID=630403 RepID=UPI000462FEE8|nr:molybdenum cofactor guanylyltransferase [Tomitella biformata]